MVTVSLFAGVQIRSPVVPVMLGPNIQGNIGTVLLTSESQTPDGCMLSVTSKPAVAGVSGTSRTALYKFNAYNSNSKYHDNTLTPLSLALNFIIKV